MPGEGITAATVVDGHSMAKKGEAGRALGAGLMSSLVGAMFGAFALALAIGAPECFVLAILGITFVPTLSGGNMVKGLTVGGFGLALAMVGLSPVDSAQRSTLGRARRCSSAWCWASSPRRTCSSPSPATVSPGSGGPGCSC